MTTSANAMRVPRVNATADSGLLEAYAQLSTGIKRPAFLINRLKDASRGRAISPLGLFPRDSEECARAGGSWFYITRPLYVQLARLRALCNRGCSVTMKERIKRVAKEDADSQIALTNLALAGDFATPSEIATADRELREELVEKELLAEELESKLYAEKK